MATIDITGSGYVTTTSTGVLGSAQDVSSINLGDHSVTISVSAVSGHAAIVIETSVDSFATAVPVMLVDISGPLSVVGGERYTRRAYEMPSSLVGHTSAQIRARVAAISGSLTVAAQVLA